MKIDVKNLIKELIQYNQIQVNSSLEIQDTIVTIGNISTAKAKKIYYVHSYGIKENDEPYLHAVSMETGKLINVKLDGIYTIDGITLDRVYNNLKYVKSNVLGTNNCGRPKKVTT